MGARAVGGGAKGRVMADQLPFAEPICPWCGGEFMGDLCPCRRPPVDTPLPVPYAVGSDTSEEAAKRIEPHVNSQRGQLLELLRAHPAGLTDEQMQAMAAMAGHSQSPRRLELQRLGWVRDSGRRRLTRSGRNAVVWEIVP